MLSADQELYLYQPQVGNVSRNSKAKVGLILRTPVKCLLLKIGQSGATKHKIVDVSKLIYAVGARIIRHTSSCKLKIFKRFHLVLRIPVESYITGLLADYALHEDRMRQS